MIHSLSSRIKLNLIQESLWCANLNTYQWVNQMFHWLCDTLVILLLKRALWHIHDIRIKLMNINMEWWPSQPSGFCMLTFHLQQNLSGQKHLEGKPNMEITVLSASESFQGMCFSWWCQFWEQQIMAAPVVNSNSSRSDATTASVVLAFTWIEQTSNGGRITTPQGSTTVYAKDKEWVYGPIQVGHWKSSSSHLCWDKNGLWQDGCQGHQWNGWSGPQPQGSTL